MKLSIVIPARNEHPAATFTLQALWDQLEGSGLDWETILVDNLSDDKTGSFAEKRYWGGHGRHHVIRYEAAGSCWQSRNAGLEMATGDIVFLFDAHVLPSPDLIQKQMEFFRTHPEADVLYTPVVWMGDTKNNAAYGYALHMERKFWGSWTRRKVSDQPYMVPMSGTAGVAVRSGSFDGWPAPMSIYGGGEQWLSLLTWMCGGSCWIHPETYVYHLADTRKYSDDPSRDWRTNEAHHFNKCLVAYALGGVEWWEKLLNLCLKNWGPTYHTAARNIAELARAEGKPYREMVEAKAIYTLDEVLETEPWMARQEVGT